MSKKADREAKAKAFEAWIVFILTMMFAPVVLTMEPFGYSVEMFWSLFGLGVVLSVMLGWESTRVQQAKVKELLDELEN